MRKSNSKEARRAIEAYVLEEVETINERSEYDGKLNPARPVSSAFETICEEMDYQSAAAADQREIMGAGLAAKYEAAGRYNHIAATTPYWVWYLAASQGEFFAYTEQARALLRDCLQETPEEAARYSDGQVWDLYRHLTASAFERLYQRENRTR